jgi:hypothetical protein
MSMAGCLASDHEVGLGRFRKPRVSRWNQSGVRIHLSPIVVVLLLVILGLFPAVGLDSDPATSNVPTAVLVSETRVRNEDTSVRIESCDPLVPRSSLKVFVQHLIESTRLRRQRYRSQVRSIRGP